MKENIKDVLLQELVGHLLLEGSKQKPVILCPQKQGDCMACSYRD